MLLNEQSFNDWSFIFGWGGGGGGGGEGCLIVAVRVLKYNMHCNITTFQHYYNCSCCHKISL